MRIQCGCDADVEIGWEHHGNISNNMTIGCELLEQKHQLIAVF